VARRRQEADDDSGLDSLLDTMTNVVGILIIVLVVTQLGVQSTVKRIASSVRVDPAALESLIEKLEQANQDKQQLEEEIKALDPEETNLEELLKRLQSESNSKRAVLKSKQGELKKAIIGQKNAAEAAKKAEENKEKREQLSQELSTAIAKIAKLEAVLDDTPPRAQKAAKVVNLPDPRPAPEGIKQLIFLCANNQVYPLNAGEIRANARKRAEYQAQKGLRKYVDDPKQGIDGEKFVKDFNQRVLQDEFFRAEMYNQDGNPRLRLTPRTDEGFNISEIQNPRSRFRRLLNTVLPSKFYFRFFVLPESYAASVETRHVVDELNSLSGWEPQHENWEYSTGLGGPLFFGPPKKEDPNKPKPAAPTAKPNVLD